MEGEASSWEKRLRLVARPFIVENSDISPRVGVDGVGEFVDDLERVVIVGEGPAIEEGRGHLDDRFPIPNHRSLDFNRLATVRIDDEDDAGLGGTDLGRASTRDYLETVQKGGRASGGRRPCRRGRWPSE